MNELTRRIREDMKPALGVTEPGAIAFAVSKAFSYVRGNIRKICVRLNSGMYKNAYTCGIPNSDETGAAHAAALGAVCGKPELGLEALAAVTAEDNARARKLTADGRVQIIMTEISSVIRIEATVETDAGACTVCIQDEHTKIVKIIRDGEVIYEAQEKEAGTDDEEAICEIHDYTLKELCRYIKEVPADEISFIRRSWEMNLKLFEKGMDSPKTTVLHYLYEKNGNRIVSEDMLATAQLLSGGAIEARVLGIDAPAMSITGSGAHGIIATLPLYAVYRIGGYSEEELLRATALSFLVTQYIKEYSGRLSAFCGCGIAAGIGMACGALWMQGGSLEQMGLLIDNMACGITGMICDGGNHGCAMKSIAAVDVAFRSVDMALHNTGIPRIHGICGASSEETMKNIGRIASPGMTGTEKTIVDIFAEKSCN